MASIGERLQEEMGKLRQQRDELRVQVNLGQKEAADAWSDVEKRMSKLEAHAAQVANESKEVADDVLEAAKLLAEEVKDGLTKLAKMIRD